MGFCDCVELLFVEIGCNCVCVLCVVTVGLVVCVLCVLCGCFCVRGSLYGGKVEVMGVLGMGRL